MQWAFTVTASLRDTCEGALQNHQHGTSHSETAQLFGRGKRLIEPRLAAIRSIVVDDPALGSFIDS